MSKFAIFIAVVIFAQIGSAAEFSSLEIATDEGTNGSIHLRVDNYGTYSALFRKTEIASKTVLCETLKNSYWERINGDLVFWSLGRAQLIPCHSKKCLLLEVGRTSPLFPNEVIELTEVPDGTFDQTPDATGCE